MKPFFQKPFNTRLYPSPRTGSYVTALVKETPIDDYPDDFVKSNMNLAHASKNSLFTGDVGGGRPWRPKEFEDMGKLGFIGLQESSWCDIWQIDTVQPLAVLDLLKYTSFYDEKTMDRFDEFDGIVLPLMVRYSGFVTKSCSAGVSVYFQDLPADVDWKGISGLVWDFNIKYFGCEASTRSLNVKSFKATSSLWFGYM